MRVSVCWPCVAAISLLAASTLAGETPTQAEVDRLREALLENFNAQNREDTKGVVNSLHPRVAREDGETLARELESCFEETNVRLRLVSMNVHSYEDPSNPGRIKIGRMSNGHGCSAYADVAQLTLPSDHSYADLDDYPGELSSDCRHNSAMLATHQLVAYTVRFEYDYAARPPQWKVFRIISKVTPVNAWPENIRGIMQGEPATTTSRNGIASEPTPKRRGPRQ
jgi:hypothetical protein